MPDHIRLPAIDTDSPGPYKIETVPYFWGVMHALDNPICWMVAVEKASQIGYTVLLAGWICKVAKTDPSRILALFPKDEKGRKFIDEKFAPIIEASPEISRLIDVSTGRKSGNRAMHKKFPGGELTCLGSNSVSNVKSTTAKRGIVEEPDDANKDIGDQGDAIRLFRERLKRLREKKLLIGGTPSVDGLSQVQHYVELGTKRVLPVLCHDCRESHVLDWEYVSWPTKPGGTPHPVYGLAQPDSAVYSCPHCGSVWDDYRRKRNIIETCEAARDSGDKFCGFTKTQCGDGYRDDEPEPIESFMELSELYVCMDGTSLADVVRDYLEAEHEARLGDESARIVFQNAKLGRPYRYGADAQLDSVSLQDAAEDYPELECPDGGLLVTTGIDMQHDRLAVIIRAFGRNEESWQMHWGEIEGDVADKSDPCWKVLDDLLFQKFTHAKFGNIFLSSVTLDTSDGATSNAGYNWVRTRSRKHPGILIMAGKGSSDDYGNREIFTLPRPLDRNNAKRPTKADKFGVQVYQIGTHKAKDLIAKRLTGTSAYMHSCKHVRGDYWEQMTAEVKAPSKRHRGRMLWQPRPGVRNEATDCEVYALHAAHARGMHRMTPARWDAIEAKLSQKTLFDQQPAAAKQPSTKGKKSQPVGSLLGY